jgi:hypothetical protein
MKLNTTPRIQADPVLQRELREYALQVNALSEGRLVASYNALPSVPTAGTYARGDFVRNSEPSELGSPGSRYVIFGWICTVSGTPGTFVQMRYLTGN